MRRPYFLLFAAVLVVSAAAQNPSAKPIARPAVAANAVPGGPIQTAVENYLRKLYAWGPAYRVKVGPPKDAPVADLLEVSIEVSLGDQTDFAVIYVSKD